MVGIGDSRVAVANEGAAVACGTGDVKMLEANIVKKGIDMVGISDS